MTLPRRDSSGRYELLLRSRCPFCDATVYLARHAEHLSENLFALHEEVPHGAAPCMFDEVVAQKPHETVKDVMKLATKKDLESFVALTENSIH